MITFNGWAWDGKGKVILTAEISRRRLNWLLANNNFPGWNRNGKAVVISFWLERTPPQIHEVFGFAHDAAIIHRINGWVAVGLSVKALRLRVIDRDPTEARALLIGQDATRMEVRASSCRNAQKSLAMTKQKGCVPAPVWRAVVTGMLISLLG